MATLRVDREAMDAVDRIYNESADPRDYSDSLLKRALKACSLSDDYDVYIVENKLKNELDRRERIKNCPYRKKGIFGRR